ncbi:hypothetical protein NMS01_003113 [Vibrio cholerae]|nr:hypothetical protein [Vibrio cholerae]
MQGLTLIEWIVLAGCVSSCIALLGYFNGKVTTQKKWFLFSHASCLMGILIVLLAHSAIKYFGAFFIVIGIVLFMSNFVFNVFFAKSN